MTNSTRETVAKLLVAFSGQQNTLTIPRPYIDLCDGDILAALLLSQCVYWTDRTKDENGWFAKSYQEWQDELGMTQYQVNRAAKLLKDMGLETKLRKFNGAPTVHYRINMAVFSQCIMKFLDNPGLSSFSIIHHEETSQSLTEPTAKPTTKLTSQTRARNSENGIPSKESQTVSKSKTPPPPHSAHPSTPGRPRHKLAVYGGQDTYADGSFIDAGTPDFLDACNGIFYAWLDALEELGRRPDTSLTTLWEKNRDAVKALAQHRRTPEQITTFVRYVYSDKYRDDFYRRNPSPITLQAVTGAIAGWLNTQKPKQAINFEERPPLYPPRQQFSEEAKERIRQIRIEALQ